jgi:5-methylcytosine-specific restriction endonuclease McrA
MICTYCKKQPATDGKKKCQKCLEKVKNSGIMFRLKSKEKGICYRCGINPLTTHSICDGCRVRHKAEMDHYKNERVANGLCAECGKSPLSGKSRSCETCILKAMAKAHFKDVKKWLLLRQIFDSNLVCPYSGIQLVLGNNASLDHRIPKSKGGSDEIENLQFIHVWCNTIKSNTEESIFLDNLNEFAMNVIKNKSGVDYGII